MTHARIPNFATHLPSRMLLARIMPADPIHAAIERHRAALDDYRTAPSLITNDEVDGAFDALVVTACASRGGAMALLAHLRTFLTGPYVALMRADGFVPFPAAQPTAMMAIAHAIPLEAAFLLEAAHAEYGRRCAAYHGGSVEEVSAAAARLYRELRIGELSAIARQPYPRTTDQQVDDAVLADAVPNLVRLDAEIDASIRRGEADGSDGAEVTPAHAELEAQRNALLACLKTKPAEGLVGLRAKAQALLLERVQECEEEAAAVGEALAADVLRLTVGPGVFALQKPDRETDSVCLAPKEAAFLEVLPAVLPLLRQIIPAEAEMSRLYAEAEAVAGPCPSLRDEVAHLAWSHRCDEAQDANGYHAAWRAASAIEVELTALVERFERVPMQTLPAILLKVALNGLAEWWGESAYADLRRLSAERFGVPVSERQEA